jgi:hypothetical protein
LAASAHQDKEHNLKTEYEIEHILLGNIFSKARKLAKLKELNLDTDERTAKILDGEPKEEVLARAEADDKLHWITLLGRRAASDLLTLGKVQPETMLEMSALPEEDFRAVVKVATGTARKLNDLTVEAEKELNLNTISSELV